MLKLGLCLDGQCPLETACVSACLATGWVVKHTERHDGSTLHNSFPGCGPNEGGGGIKCREEAPNGRTDKKQRNLNLLSAGLLLSLATDLFTTVRSSFRHIAAHIQSKIVNRPSCLRRENKCSQTVLYHEPYASSNHTCIKYNY